MYTFYSIIYKIKKTFKIERNEQEHLTTVTSWTGKNKLPLLVFRRLFWTVTTTFRVQISLGTRKRMSKVSRQSYVKISSSTSRVKLENKSKFLR